MFRAGDDRTNVLLKLIRRMYGDAMFVPLSGEQTWRLEANKSICH